MTLRTSLMRHALLAAALLLPCAADAQRQRARPRADVILTGGKIFTSDFRRPYVQAIAIRGDRVLAIGTNAEVRATAGPNTREIALEGRTAIPGLNDARVYVGAPEVGEVVRLRRDDPSMRDVLDAVRDAARRHPDGTWLRATIGPNALGDRNATRAALDRVAQRHPVMLKSASGHGILLNSAALAELGMPDGGLDPAGGWLERDSAGTVIGFAHGYTQWTLERALAGRRSDSAFIALVRARADSALRAGITSLQLVSRYQPTETALGALVALESPLRWRVIRVPLTDSTGRLTTEPRPTVPRAAAARITLDGTEWTLDGTIVERGALMRSEYADREGWMGRGYFSADTVGAIVAEAFASREPLQVTASGDSTLALVLGAMNDTSRYERWRARRLRVTYADALSPGLIQLAKRVGIAVVQNPARFTAAEVARRRLPRHITPSYQPLRTLVRQGIPLGFGSDGELDPFRHIMYAVMHPTNPSEALTLEQAVVAYTRGSAAAEGLEDRKGTLWPGMLADMAVLSQDIFRVPTAQLPATEARMVIVGGKVVYEK